MTPAEVHNRDVGRIVRAIVSPTLHEGGGYTDVLVLLESVMVGVLMVCVKLGGDDIVVDKLVESVKTRIAEMRLIDTEPKGTG